MEKLTNTFFRNKQFENPKEERYLVERIRRFLNAKGLSYEIHKGVLLSYEESDRYPDIYIPGLLLVIELDGNGHDQTLHAMKHDLTREQFYADLGLRMITFSDDGLFDDVKFNERLSELIDWAKSSHPSMSEINRVKQRISRGRLEYVARNLNLGSIPTITVLKSLGYEISFGSGQWFGGLRFFAKRRPKPSQTKIRTHT